MKNKKNILVTVCVFAFISVGLFFTFKKNNPMADKVCEDCNVIVISLSNLRKDNMSLYGAKRLTTPIIDNFFNDSFVFEKAIAPASLTFTDAMSFFYSLQPNIHQFMNRNDRNKTKAILKNYQSFPEILKKEGYTTAAFVSDEDYAFDNGFGKLFDFYFDKSLYSENGIAFNPWQYNIGTKDLVGPAIKWLESNASKKFVMFFQAYDMHCPYTPSSEFSAKYAVPKDSQINFNECFITLKEVEKTKKEGKEFYQLYDWHSFLDKKKSPPTLFSEDEVRYLKDLYDAELENADQNLKLFFETIKKLGLEKKTIIVFMSEHGDYLGENGYFMKAAVTAEGNLHNVNIGFPLAIKHPLLKGPYRQKQLIQTIDIAPTILDMLGLEAEKEMQGKSFFSELGNEKPLNDFAYSYAERKRNFKDRGNFVVQAIQNNEWKYTSFKHQDFEGNVIEEQEKLFNLKSDPEEKVNIGTLYPEQLSQMRIKNKEKFEFYEKKN